MCTASISPALPDVNNDAGCKHIHPGSYRLAVAGNFCSTAYLAKTVIDAWKSGFFSRKPARSLHGRQTMGTS
jgi:hypothetical protein